MAVRIAQSIQRGRTLLGSVVPLVWAAVGIYLLSTMTVQAMPLSTKVGGTMVQSTTWTKAGSPYMVVSSISISNQAVLTIEPGVIVKFASGTKLFVEPNSVLSAVGSAAEPIVFTSLRDDSYGGDTNGDGQTTKALPGDWGGLESGAEPDDCYNYDYGGGYGYSYNCAHLKLQHAIVRYSGAGGSSAIYSRDILLLLNVVVERNAGDGITVKGSPDRNIYTSHASVDLRQSTIHDNGGSGLVSRGEVYPVVIENNTFSGNQHAALALGDLGNNIYDYDVASQLRQNTQTAAIIIMSGNEITVQSEKPSARGLLLDNVNGDLVVADNLFNRAAASPAFAAIETSGTTVQFTGNQVQGFPVALHINNSYPQVLPILSKNDFANTLSGASVAVGGFIGTGTWTAVSDYQPLLYGNVTLSESETFTIPVSTVVKFYLQSSLTVEAGAKLYAVGSAAQPIIFTSYRDAAYALSNQSSLQTAAAEPGDWGCLTNRGANAHLVLQHTHLRFGGGDGVGSICASGNLILSDSIVEESGSNALYIAPNSTSSTVSIERNTIRNNANNGIEVERQPLALSILNNTLRNNYVGLYLRALESAQVSNNTIRVIGSSASLRGIVLEQTTNGVVIGNNIVEQQADGSGYAAIEVRNASAQLTGNTVSGFEVPVVITSGYPQRMPSYTGNNFTNNRYGARIAVGGLIKQGTWVNGGGYPHIISGYTTLENGAILTVPAGSVIKFDLNASLNLGAGSQLSAVGNSGARIIFTSILDGAYGGTLPSATLSPQPGDWISIWGRGNNSSLNLHHVIARYSRDAAVGANGSLTLLDSTIEHSLRDGVYVAPNQGTSPSVTISRVKLHNVGRHAIRVEGQPATLTISDNVITSDGALAAQEAEISAAEVDNTISTGIFLRNLSTALVKGNKIEIALPDVAARGILLENVGGAVALMNNIISRVGDSNAFAGIESRNSTSPLTGNQVSGFNIGLLIGGGYPKQIPPFADNDFSGNQYRNSLGVSGQIMDGNWYQDGVETTVIQGVATLQPQAKLIIPAGTIIKFTQAAGLELGQGAQLFATGTVTQPVVFTTILDDEYGGDTNGDRNKSMPQPGDWGHLGSRSSSSQIELRHTLVRFGGGSGNGALVTQGALLLSNSTVEWSKQSGVYLDPNASPLPPVTIERSYINNNQIHGINIVKAPNPITIAGNGFLNNRLLAINNQDASVVLNSRGNWWGDASGPADTGNPTGEGDRVSPGIDYIDWLTAMPLFVPITVDQALPSLSTASPDSFEPDDRCGQAGTIALDGARQERLFHVAGDVDWVRFTVTAGVTYRVEAQTPAGSIADINLDLFTTCDSIPAETWQATFTPGVRLDFEAPFSGPIYLRLSNHRPEIYGATATYSLSVREFRQTTDKGALIIVAGRLTMTDPLQPNIHHVTNNVYELFKDNGYSDDKIQYLATDPALPGYDAPATLANLQSAITSWAASRVGTERPLTLYLMDHGGIDIFYVDHPNGQRLKPSDLNQWLNQLETAVPGVRINAIIEACHSGSFIKNVQGLAKQGRMIISSTNVQNVAFASANGAQFSDRFLTSLREGYSLVNSFWDAERAVRRLHALQEPWIDTNGNGIPNESEDGSDPQPNNPGVDQLPADTWAPYIVTARGPIAIVNGKGLIQVEVRDNKGVKRVWAAIYPPSYVSPTSSDELVAEDLPALEFMAQGNHQFSAEYTQFHESGTYRIALYAEDISSLKARLYVLEVFTGRPIYMPSIMR
jgi:nitrous oxidase accessory protein NosD